jgi:membrane protease YdiL (CAAX protease family)
MPTKADNVDTAIRPQTGLRQLVARHPLVTFFVLCYALSWTLWIPIVVLRDAIAGPVSTLALVVGSNVPSAVAIFLTAVSRGRHGTRQLLGKLLIWRIRPRWYLMLLAPTALVLVSITVVAVLLGGPTATLGMPVVAAVITVALMTFPGSAFGEEVGWRGYALPRLQSIRTALIASLVLGILHGLWHLPLWLMGDPDNQLSLYPAFVIQVIAVAVIYTWLYNGTKGSLLLAVLFHTALNAPLTLVLLPLGPENVTLPFWLLSGLWVVAAIIVVAVFGPSQLSRQQRLQELPETSTRSGVQRTQHSHEQHGHPSGAPLGSYQSTSEPLNAAETNHHK